MVVTMVPPEHRGRAAGMRATLWNAGITASRAVVFTFLIAGMSDPLRRGLGIGLASAGALDNVVAAAASVSPGSAIFAALVGRNPLSALVPADALSQLSAQAQSLFSDPRAFAALHRQRLAAGLRAAFAASIAICVVAVLASILTEARRPSRQTAGAPAHGAEPSQSRCGETPQDA
jgi:hypothetical protein